MRELEHLKKQWVDSARFRGIQANLHLDREGLTLGAGTVVAKRNHDGSLALDDEEAKVLTLLSVAHGQAVDPSTLKTLRRASGIARDGDECKAAMHIALAKLPRISDPVDAARRLFIAEGLIAAGVAPRDIWKALEFDPAVLDSLAKYDQNEPRVPAGSGNPSGQWTSGGTAIASAATAIGALAPVAVRAEQAVAQEAEAQAPRILARLPGVALRLAAIAARLDLPLSALIETLRASPTGGEHLTGSIRGLPGLQYSRHQDEPGLNVVMRSNGQTILTLYPRGQGRFVNSEEGVVAQMEGGELVIRSVASGVSQAQVQRKKPQLCPDPPVPDHKGMIGPRGDRSRGYEFFMKEKTNPDEPTPPGMAFGLENPVTGDLVRFDDCEQATGNMMEYKGLGIARLLRSERSALNIAGRFTREATSQVLAAAGRHVVWNFAEPQTMEFARELFEKNPLLEGIELRYQPWAEGERWKWSRSKRAWLRALILLRLRKRLFELRNSLRFDAHRAR